MCLEGVRVTLYVRLCLGLFPCSGMAVALQCSRWFYEGLYLKVDNKGEGNRVLLSQEDVREFCRKGLHAPGLFVAVSGADGCCGDDGWCHGNFHSLGISHVPVKTPTANLSQT